MLNQRVAQVVLAAQEKTKVHHKKNSRYGIGNFFIQNKSSNLVNELSLWVVRYRLFSPSTT